MEMDEVEDARRSRMDALKKSSSRRLSKRKKDDNDDRVMIGTPIGEDHVNYVLMYNMLTGIRVSVSPTPKTPVQGSFFNVDQTQDYAKRGRRANRIAFY